MGDEKYINQLDINGEPVLDLTKDTVLPETLLKGATAHDATGKPITGTMEVGDFIIHVRCLPQHLFVESSENDYWVYSPHQLTPAEYIEAYEAGRSLKIKAEIPMDDGSMLTIAAPFTGENSTNPWELAFVVTYGQTEYKFTIHQATYGFDSSGNPIDRVYVRIHDLVEIQSKANMVTSISEASTNDQYPSALAVVSYVDEAIENVGIGNDDGNSAEQGIFYITAQSASGGSRKTINCEYQDVLDAIDANKVIVVNGNVATVISYSDDETTVVFPKLNGQEEYVIRSNKLFGNVASYTHLTPNHTVSIIDDSVTHGKVPTAKAVVDYVKANGGSGSGGGGIAVQSDYAENNPASAAYIKNRPFYDKSLSSHFSGYDTPNPISFDTPIGFVFHKVSDLMLDVDKLLGTNFTYKVNNGFVLSLTPAEENILYQSEDGVILYFTPGVVDQFCYYVAYNTGNITVNFMGTPVPITVPETGIYVAMEIGDTAINYCNVDILYEDIKKIDKKFIPNSDGIAVIDVVISIYDLEGDMIPLDEETGLKVYDVATSGVPCFLRLTMSGASILLSHVGFGVFTRVQCYAFDSQVTSLEYNHKSNGLDIYTQVIESSSASSATYGLRRPTGPTLADIVEMLRQSAIERGLLTEELQGGDFSC